MNRTCSRKGCDRKTLARDLCGAHYYRQQEDLPMDEPIRDGTRKCSHDGCTEKYRAKGFCRLHYTRNRNGTPLDQSIQKKDGKQGCKFEGCDKDHTGYGYCSGHNEQRREGKELIPLRGYDGNQGCSVKDCPNKHFCNGLCAFHNQRKREGTSLEQAKEIHDPTRTCTYKNCNEKYFARGRCERHWHSKWMIDHPHVSEVESAKEQAKMRDNFTCKWHGCDVSKNDGGKMHGHHIFPEEKYPELKLIVKFITTYCQKHHALWHHYNGDELAAGILGINKFFKKTMLGIFPR